MFLGSGSDNARQALVIGPGMTTDVFGGSVQMKIRAAGLPHVRATVQRTSNVTTTLSVTFYGQIGNDVFTPISTATAMVPAAAGQIVTPEVNTNGFTVIQVIVQDLGTTGVGATGLTLTLSATFT